MDSKTEELLLDDIHLLMKTLPDPNEIGISPNMKASREKIKSFITGLQFRIENLITVDKTYKNMVYILKSLSETEVHIILLKKALLKSGVSLEEIETIHNKFKEIRENFIMRINYYKQITYQQAILDSEKEKANLQTITGFRGLRSHITPSYNASIYPTPESHYITKSEQLRPNRSLHSSAIRNAFLITDDPTSKYRAWMEAQISYMNELKPKDVSMLQGYTFFGDVLLNNYLRGAIKEDLTKWVTDYTTRALKGRSLAWRAYPFITYLLYDNYHLFQEALTLPPKPPVPNNEILKYLRQVFIGNISYFSQSRNILPLIEQFKHELIRIINNAPRPTFPLIVYRGLKSESHLTTASYKMNDFLSTSTYVNAALKFSSKMRNGYRIIPGITKYYGGLYELTVEPGSPCLFISQVSLVGEGEKEILFPPGLTIELDNKVLYKDLSKITFDPKGAETVGVITGRIRISPEPLKTTNYVWDAVNMAPVSYKSARKTRMDKGSPEDKRTSKERRTFKQSRQTRLNRTLAHLHNS